jgi:hypothetical protein
MIITVEKIRIWQKIVIASCETTALEELGFDS